MSYDGFLEQMKKDLEGAIAADPGKYSQVKIGIRDVEKVQGESYRGISFKIGDSPVEGNLNMESAYQAYKAGESYDGILEQIEDTIKEQAEQMLQFKIEQLADYPAMKASLMMELIPQKGNEERLAATWST